MRRSLNLASVLLLLLLVGLLAACAQATPTPTVAPTATSTPAPPPPSLTIYSGRSQELVGPIIDQFSKATGIKVSVRYGDTAQLAATIAEEGRRSPADVFFAQDPGGLGAISTQFAPLPDTILSQVPAWARSPEGKWVGLSGRARVVVYNTKKLTEADLPKSIMDFTDPKWRGRIGWPPTNASFQAMVTAIRATQGEEAARKWLDGMKANNPKVYPNNTSIVKAVGDGEIDIGFVNHYYLFRFLQEQGESYPARNYYLKAPDPGAIVLVAGAGILSTSKNQEAAQKFLEFMLSPVAQQYFASQTYEYPLVPKITTHRALTPLDKLQPLDIDVVKLSDLDGTLKLLRSTGIVP